MRQLLASAQQHRSHVNRRLSIARQVLTNIGIRVAGVQFANHAGDRFQASAGLAATAQRITYRAIGLALRQDHTGPLAHAKHARGGLALSLGQFGLHSLRPTRILRQKGRLQNVSIEFVFRGQVQAFIGPAQTHLLQLYTRSLRQAQWHSGFVEHPQALGIAGLGHYFLGHRQGQARKIPTHKRRLQVFGSLRRRPTALEKRQPVFAEPKANTLAQWYIDLHRRFHFCRPGK
ncbi:hypothetical protein D3C86_1387160 [compost metagenome]